MKKAAILLAILFTLCFGFVALYYWMNSEVFQIAGEIIPRVETQEKVVALTFDDGPTEQVTAILKTLKEREVVATFYVIGQEVEKNPAAARQIVLAGHELGNHSYSHQRMVFQPKDFMATEIEKTDQLIREVGYQGEITFRPPFGKKLIALPLYLKDHKIKTITWNVEPLKALGSGASTADISHFVKNKTKPGSIILIHPWYGEQNNSREAIGGLIDALKAEGYHFVTVNELISSQ